MCLRQETGCPVTFQAKMDFLNRLGHWLASRPLKWLVALIVVETLIFLGLLGVLVWVILNR